MTGFAPEWLTLREPADHAAVNHAVRRALLTHLAGRDEVSVIDFGCGTGSNFRGLAPEIPGRQHWTLVDHDSRLLERAATLTGDIAAATGATAYPLEADLANDDIRALAADNDLVTAAALFDLVSQNRIVEMASAIAATGAAFYTVLTFDGIASWLPETPLAASLRHAFNRHQATDKGFGPAAGPDASRYLARAFEAAGYTVITGRSPWVLDDDFIALRRETDRGWVAASVEMDEITVEDGEAWLDARANDPDAVTIVGHIDLIALPPAV
jgi:SAM-dependent methyltransferase